MRSSKSIYEIVYNNLLDQILNNTYKVNDYLPSESELEKFFNASRTPIRKALNQLQNDGYILRQKGKGSIVKSIYPTGNWTMMTGFQHNYVGDHANRQRIRAKTIKIKKVEHEKYARQLNLFMSNELTYLERLRYFNNKPVIYLEHYVHSNIDIQYFIDNLNAITVADILASKLNYKVTQAKEEIEAVLASNKIAEYLNVDTSTPLLKIKRLTMTDKESPVDINIYYVRTDTWKYLVNYNF